jgi:phosphatidylinositol alpha-1,6-mannosyltransferase
MDTYLEAAAAGRPSITGNTGGQPEAVKQNKTGLIVDGNNVDSIAEGIFTLASNPELREKMGLAGRNEQWNMTGR